MKHAHERRGGGDAGGASQSPIRGELGRADRRPMRVELPGRAAAHRTALRGDLAACSVPTGRTTKPRQRRLRSRCVVDITDRHETPPAIAYSSASGRAAAIFNIARSLSRETVGGSESPNSGMPLADAFRYRGAAGLEHEDLAGDVGIDVGLGQKGADLAARDALDHFGEGGL